jgi:high-affinity K+ transport system ATPase subunit B
MCWPPAAAPSKRRATWTFFLLDKTGTITLGNRQATEFIAAPGVKVEELADAAQLASLADETPEGRSIVALAKEKYGLRGREIAESFRDLYSIYRANAHERRGPL